MKELELLETEGNGLKRTTVLRAANHLGQLLVSLVLIAVGVLLLVIRDLLVLSAAYLLGAALVVIGVLGIVGWFLHQGRRWFELLGMFLCIPFGILIIFNTVIPMTIVVILFGLYLLVIGIIKAIDAVLLWQEEKAGFLLSTFQCLVFLCLGVTLLIAPWDHISTVFTILAIYLLILGGFQLIQAIHELVPGKVRQKVSRRIRFPLPTVIEALLPFTVQCRVNRYLAREQTFDQLKEEIPPREEGEPALEVFIHVADGGGNAIGHCDICFEGTMYAFGSYDEAAQHLGIAPGVLIVSKKEEYIPFTSGYAHTTIFGFGLRLTEEQKELVRKRLKEIMANTYRWYPPYQQALELDPKANLEDFTDYPSRLSVCTQTKMYKFSKSKYKHYFVFTTNCAMLALDILGKMGLDVLNFNGILSPGTIYDFLETEYLNRGGLVIQRNIYRMTPKGLLTTDGDKNHYSYRKGAYRNFNLKPVINMDRWRSQHKKEMEKNPGQS